MRTIGTVVIEVLLHRSLGCWILPPMAVASARLNCKYYHCKKPEQAQQPRVAKSEVQANGVSKPHPIARYTLYYKYLSQLNWPRCMLKIYMTYMYRELTCTHLAFVLSLIFARSMA